MFQSPSLRGSGRFEWIVLWRGILATSFNPLHCGAVVASLLREPQTRHSVSFQSPSLRGSGRFNWLCALFKRVARFQSPSLRGSGRFSKAPRTRRRCGRRVSIPFIAGQWSLLSASGTSWGVNPSCFNPLHCGAVVASGDGPRTLLLEGPCFNPLHCGAVVASKREIAAREAEAQVSIPFIAGQWSLLRGRACAR